MTTNASNRRKKYPGASSPLKERSPRSSFFAKFSKPLEVALNEYLKTH